MVWLKDNLIYTVVLLLLVVPLYPKFPLVGVSGTFVSVRIEDILIALVAGLWLTTLFPRMNRIWDQPVKRSIILYWLAGAVSVFSAVFVIKSAELNLGFLHWARRVEYMILFFVAYDSLKNLNQLAWVVRTMMLVAAIVAVYGIGQMLFDFPVISTNNSEFSKGLALSLGPGARINSTFAGHYDLAAYSLFPILLGMGLLASKIRGKMAVAAITATAYWVMLLSASRVTFAALFISITGFLWVLKKKTWLAAWLILSGVSIWLSPQLVGRYKELIYNQLLTAVSSVSAQVDEEVADALKPPADMEDRSLNIRLNVEWPRALRAVAKNPILGTGYSSLGLAVDNDYLRSLGETGILGTLAFAGVFWRIFKALWQKRISANLSGIFPAAVIFAVIGLLLNAIFIDVFEASKVAIITWILVGLAVKTKILADEKV